MNEGTLGVHQIELVIEAGPCLGNGRGVGQHAHGTLHLGQITAGHDGGWLVVDADLEASRAPVHELDGTLGLDGGDGRIDVLGHHVSTVQHAAGHVLAVAWVTLHHLVGRLEAGVGDLGHAELLVVSLLSRDDGSVSDEREVDTWIGHQVGLEFCEIDIQGTIEAKGSGDRGDDLSDKTVKVGVGGSLYVEVPAADVVDGLIVHHEGGVGVLQSGMGGQDGIVGLHYSGGDLGGGVDGELELRLLTVVDRKTLHEKRSETGASASTEGVEDKESLETCALVSELADPVEYEIDHLLSDGVVATGVVVGCIFFSGEELLRVEQLAVGASAHLVCKKIQCRARDSVVYIRRGGADRFFFKRREKSVRSSLGRPVFSHSTHRLL